MSMLRFGRHDRLAVVMLVLLAVIASAPPTAAQNPTARARAQDRALLGRLDARSEVARHPGTGRLRYLGGSLARPLVSPRALGVPATSQAAARAFLSRFGALVGISRPDRQVRLERVTPADRGRTFVRYQQVHRGVPVMAGQLIVEVGPDRGVVAVHGEVAVGLPGSTDPRITAAAARRTAIRVVARATGTRAVDLRAATPRRTIWDPRLMGGPGLPVARLAWQVAVTAPGAPVDQLVIVDARTGALIVRIDQVHPLVPLRICDQRDDRVGQGTYGDRYPCDAGEGVSDPGGSSVADVRDAWDALRGTFDFYLDHWDRDGIADDGATAVATVRYCSTVDPCPYANAAWIPSESQMVVGRGWASDDVMGHEVTHGVTEAESGLYYYYQSGAINEALSDIFGEAIDQETPMGDDRGSVKWRISEDVVTGGLRDMADPPRFGDPDRMTSTYYQDSSFDQGGVHTNSGVANKAAFLLQDGGRFNGHTITGLGRAKAIAIWYEAAIHHLTNGSDYPALADALAQACDDLRGTTPNGDSGTPISAGPITSGDCTQLDRVIAATEMELDPPGSPTPSTPLCHDAAIVSTLNETVSGSDQDWTVEGANAWAISSRYSSSAPYAFFIASTSSDVASRLETLDPVAVPVGRPAFLAFKHAYDLDESDGEAADGAVVEFRLYPTQTWLDLGPFMIFNGYDGVVAADAGHGLEGRATFQGRSNGWTRTKLYLKDLHSVLVDLRFRFASSDPDGALGWWVDDIRLYSCADNGDDVGPASAPTLDLMTGSLGADETPVRVRVVSGATDPSGIIETDWQYRRDDDAYADVGQASLAVINQGYGVASTSDPQSFRMRALDEQGNWSPWRSITRVLRLTQETGGSPAVAYTGTWNIGSRDEYSGGGIRHASAAGRKASLRVTDATDLAWVTTKGPDRGKAEVWVDGVRKKTIDLYASSLTYRQVVYATSFASAGTHRIEVRVLGTRNTFSTGTRVDIDAFESIRQP